ncbi:MAG TPA: HPF/RaiA family ribosome-associated protein [Gemmatimonadales bacterium]|jgi:ribosome-associated translation inhibitor RaiA|nr:HPF/RaiA family ribosome-associated protein [Gemmatimonadales bacterium]
MQTTITARHCEVPEALRGRALAVTERLGTLASRPLEATVTFHADGLEQVVELRLHDSRGELFVATGTAADHRTALDRAEEKLRRQLEKANGRPRRSRARQAPPAG